MIYRFLTFELDEAKQQLTGDNKEILLEPKAFDVLCYLVAHHERMVSKDELINHVWRGRYTSDAALATAVKMLRKALGDTGEHQRLVKTVRGKGFRFVAELKAAELPQDEATAASALDRTTEFSSGNASDRSQLVTTENAGNEAAIQLFDARPGKPSIVVLPFQFAANTKNTSSAGVIAEGLAHDLIQSLARLRWLRVIARGTTFRFMEVDADWQKLALRHDVNYVLSGVLDAESTHPSLHLELTDSSNTEVIWAERLNAPFEAMQELNQNIVSEVVSALELYIPFHEASIAAIQSSESLSAWQNYHLGLRHMFSFSAKGNSIAAEHFSQAIKLDPAFARAYAGLSFTRFQDAFLSFGEYGEKAKKEAREYSETAITLDPLDPFTNFNFGRCYWLENDVISGQGWLEKTIKLSPNYAQGHYSLAFGSVMLEDPELASNSAIQSLSLSPLDPLLFAVYIVQAMSAMQSNNIPEATQLADKAARTPGAHYLIHMVATAIHAEAGNKAKAEFWRQRALSNKPTATISDLMLAVPIASTSLGEKICRGLSNVGFK